MALDDTLIGVIVGWVLATLSSLYFQDRSLKRHRHEATKERVYSPLFDEIEGVLEQIKRNDPPWSLTQWSKITREQHLSYLIEPADLYENLRKFYDETLSSLVNQIVGCRKAYGELVKQDLTTKVTSAPASMDTGAPKTLPAINEISNGVGWNLYKGEVWFGDLPHLNQEYDTLIPHSSQFPATFQEYFDSWKTKSKVNKVLVDYRGILDQATKEATALRKPLAKKLGKKL